MASKANTGHNLRSAQVEALQAEFNQACEEVSFGNRSAAALRRLRLARADVVEAIRNGI